MAAAGDKLLDRSHAQDPSFRRELQAGCSGVESRRVPLRGKGTARALCGSGPVRLAFDRAEAFLAARAPEFLQVCEDGSHPHAAELKDELQMCAEFGHTLGHTGVVNFRLC